MINEARVHSRFHMEVDLGIYVPTKFVAVPKTVPWI